DITHAAMDLDSERGDVDAVLGIPTLDDGDHQFYESLLALTLLRVWVMRSLVLCSRNHVGQCTHSLDLRLHQQQHAAHVGMLDDGHGPGAACYVAALHPILGVRQRLLVGAL